MCECCTSEKKDIYLPMMATVQNTKLMNETEMYVHFTMDNGDTFDYAPGQFVEVSIAGIGEAPLTISSSPTQGEDIEIVVRKIGNVSGAIHQLEKGDKVGIRGPLGEGQYPVEAAKGKNLVFICGGIGLVPQRSFIKYVLDNRGDYGDVAILMGTKEYQMRFFQDELEQWSKRDDVQYLETIDVAHEKWDGNVGVVTTLIPKVETDLATAEILVCGPPIMYKFVLMALSEFNVPKEHIYLNLERKMKCGVGKCGHCQINKYYVCVDGPVFKYSDLGVAPEAI